MMLFRPTLVLPCEISRWQVAEPIKFGVVVLLYARRAGPGTSRPDPIRVTLVRLLKPALKF